MKNTVRYITKDASAFVIACDSTSMIREMEKIHQPSAVVTAALGRLTTAASMMGVMLKGENDSITLRMNGSGPCGELIAVSDSSGNVRSYVQNNIVEIPLNNIGKLDVKSAVGTQGLLSVIKDLSVGEPYVSQTSIVSGEIAEDITNYYASSEQAPTVCSLGVLVNPDLSVKCSGGFILQLLPFCPDEVIDKIEDNIKNIDSVTNMLKSGLTPDDIAKAALDGFETDKLDEFDVAYKCTCSRKRVQTALISTGIDNLKEMAQSKEDTEVKCHFCNKEYIFTPEDIKNLINLSSQKN